MMIQPPDDDERTNSMGLFNTAEAFRLSAMALEDEKVRIGHWHLSSRPESGDMGRRMRPIFAHATDSDTNAERDYIIAELRNNRDIEDVNSSCRCAVALQAPANSSLLFGCIAPQ